MSSRIGILFFLMVTTAIYAEQKNERLTPFILDNLTLVAENEERIVFQEDYRDVIKRNIKIVREHDEQIIKFKYRVLDYGSFEVFFDLDFKVRNIFITKLGPKLLNGISIGEPVDNFLEDFQDDPRYRIEYYDNKYNEFVIGFKEWDVSISLQDPGILVEYDEERRVSYINAGYYHWP